MPSIPLFRRCVEGRAESPNIVQPQGISAFSIKASNSCCALPNSTPCPTKANGFFAELINATASADFFIIEFPDPDHLEVTRELLERIRELSGDEYFLMLHGDPTWAIPDGAHMMDFSVRMYEDPEGLNEESKQRLDSVLRAAAKLDQAGHLLDGFGLCSDYCLNANPFFTQEQFEELIQPRSAP
mgnify:CR=1 FL=1